MSPAAPSPDGVALVAGASRGLGLLIAAELINRGYRVHGCARDAGELGRVADRLGERFRGQVCDVADAEQVRAWVESVSGQGPIDVAIHVAGIIQVGPLESTALGDYRAAVDTMLLGPVHLSLAVLPGMLTAGAGHIGVVSSVGGVIAVPHLLPYSIAKFGAVGLGEGLRAELSGTGVTATTIVPGLMRTGGHLQARFVGDATKDYAWFAVAASLPLLSISAERAARLIVDGVLAGRAQVELTPLTRIGRRVHGVAPGTTSRLLGLAARLLPRGHRAAPRFGEGSSVSGAQARRDLGSRLVNALSVLGDRAAARNNDTGKNN